MSRQRNARIPVSYEETIVTLNVQHSRSTLSNQDVQLKYDCTQRLTRSLRQS